MSSPGSACFAQQVEGDGAVPGMIGRGSGPPAAEWLRGVRRRFRRGVRDRVGGRSSILSPLGDRAGAAGGAEGARGGGGGGGGARPGGGPRGRGGRGGGRGGGAR